MNPDSNDPSPDASSDYLDFWLRLRRGEDPDFEELWGMYPEIAGELQTAVIGGALLGLVLRRHEARCPAEA